MLDDQELLDRFRASALTAFPHEYHVRLAHLLIDERGEAAAAEEFMQGLRNLARNFGALPSMLHVTRTLAWIRLIAAAGGRGESTASFLAAHPELRRKNLLDDYYSRHRLNSLRARRTFVEPDLQELPGTVVLPVSDSVPSVIERLCARGTPVATGG